jgi:DNA-binding NtrC family response regulator
VLQTLRAENPGLCVILITSYGTPEILAQALGCGASGTLDKPFPPSEIIRLIASLLERAPGARS